MIKANIENLDIIRDGEQVSLLTEVKFELDNNLIYSIVGKNGTGKSTLVRALTGLLDRRFYNIDGHVIFENEDLLTLDERKLGIIRQEKIKYVFQDAKNSFDQLKKFRYYFNKLNLTLPNVEEMLHYFLLPKSGELFHLHPYEVSGGMAQRISLALALLARPALIILDEPTSGVDSAIANLFLLKLKEFVKSNSASVILVTQDLTFANRISDKIALLNNKTLTEFLKPEEFYNSQLSILSDNLVSSYIQLTK